MKQIFTRGVFMSGSKKQYTYRSASDLADIFAEGYFPAETVETKAIVQIAHGMAEHHERYEDFIAFLNDNGYAVFINDHLGHGKSCDDKEKLGYFGRHSGYINLVEDMKKLTDIAKEECPGLPLILFGHSMGSMLARIYAERYKGEIKAAVFCGTSGPNPAASVGVLVAELIMKIKGEYYRSPLINNLAFGSYNKKIENPKTPFDWLTSDEKIVDEYINDPLCGFLFTTCGYKDLFNLTSACNEPDWYTSTPLDLPIYLISGDQDPVGAYGKGIKEAYERLIASKHTNVKMDLIKNGRHEILNEIDKNDTYNKILSWMDDVLKA